MRGRILCLAYAERVRPATGPNGALLAQRSDARTTRRLPFNGQESSSSLRLFRIDNGPRFLPGGAGAEQLSAAPAAASLCGKLLLLADFHDLHPKLALRPLGLGREGRQRGLERQG